MHLEFSLENIRQKNIHGAGTSAMIKERMLVPPNMIKWF